MRKITSKKIDAFRDYLINDEKAAATVNKYTRDVEIFTEWLGERGLDKSAVLDYKAAVITQYAPTSVNAMISSLNCFFTFCEWYELRVKAIKIQRQIFTQQEKELTKAEYLRLLSAARQKKNERLYLVMQTICSTGIRISELRFVTVTATERGRMEIQCKGKRRTVFMPKQLCGMLKKYIKERKIKNGAVFITKNGTPIDRSNVWAEMKNLCEAARVSKTKVFPHNLRHLFARVYYNLQKDIVRLADILGHSSVNTTRIYTMESGEVHCRQIQRLGLVFE